MEKRKATEMMIAENDKIDVLLRGRKIKKLTDSIYNGLRKEHGLKQVEIDVLLYKYLLPEKVASDIAKELCIPKGHVSLAMDGLMDKKYIKSKRDEEDRRFVRFTITKKGMKVAEELNKIKNFVNDRLLEGMTEDEIDAFDRITEKLLTNVDELMADIKTKNVDDVV